MSKRNRRLERFLQPVDPETFMFAMECSTHAASGAMPTEDPSQRPLGLIEEDDGSITELRLTNTPLARGLTATANALDHLPYEQYMSVSMRMFALGEAIKSPALQEEIVYDEAGEVVGIQPWLVIAFATVPLEIRGEKFRFKIGKLLKEMRRIKALASQEGVRS